MFRYKVIFKDGRKRPQATIQAENLDDAFRIAEKMVRRIKRKFGETVSVHSVERLYGKPKRPQKDAGDGIGMTVLRNLDVIPHFFN